VTAAQNSLLVEKVARALVVYHGYDPERKTWDDLPIWTRYTGIAQIAVNACHAEELKGALRLLIAAKDEREQSGHTLHYVTLKNEGWKAARLVMAKTTEAEKQA